jgi:hypothetical protein
MLDPTQEVQGIAVYVEFRKESMGSVATTQMLITPDGYRTDGLFVPATIYRRAVDRWSPKRQWRATTLSTYHEPADSVPAAYVSDEQRQNHGDERLSRVVTLLRQMTGSTSYDPSPWTLVGEPLFIETSKRDLDDVSAYKTPSKVVYRIGQTRTAKKFPENLYA